MHEFKHGELKSGQGGKGGKVKSRRQAIAIALKGVVRFESASGRGEQEEPCQIQTEGSERSHIPARGRGQVSRRRARTQAKQQDHARQDDEVLVTDQVQCRKNALQEYRRTHPFVEHELQEHRRAFPRVEHALTFPHQIEKDCRSARLTPTVSKLAGSNARSRVEKGTRGPGREYRSNIALLSRMP